MAITPRPPAQRGINPPPRGEITDPINDIRDDQITDPIDDIRGETPTPVPVTPAPAPSNQPINNSTWSMLSNVLANIGLSSLFSIDANGNPRGWLYEQIVGGVTSEQELMFAIQQTPEFQNRFPSIAYQQQQNASGVPTYVMSPAEVIQYEQTVMNAFRNAGLPAWFYDNPVEDVQQRMISGLSPEAIVDRIQYAYANVANAPQEVREQFSQFFGVDQTDGALAAYMLDPEKTLASLDKAYRTAYTAGSARRYGMNLTQAQSQRVAEMPMTEAGIAESIGQVASMQGLYRESFGERQDLTAESTGFEAVLGSDAQAMSDLERRRIQRETVTSRTSGGGVLTERGVLGL